MPSSKIAKGLYSLAAVALVATPLATSAKPRRIAISSDGTIVDTTYEPSTTGSYSKTSTTSTATSTSSTSTSTSTSTATTDNTAVFADYVATLSPTYTPSEISWAGRKWRVNSGATYVTDMGHSVRVTPYRNRVRIELRNTSNDKTASDSSSVRRAELSGSLYGDPTRLPNGQSLWGAFSSRHDAWADPAGMKALTGGVYGQIHIGSKFGGSPALAFRRKSDGRYRITTRGEFSTASTVRYEGVVPFGTVHDVVYNVVLHPTAGSLRVWINGVQVVNVANVSIGHSNAESYWNVGAYFSGGITSPVVTEVANHVYPAPTSLATRVTSRPAWPAN